MPWNYHICGGAGTAGRLSCTAEMPGAARRWSMPSKLEVVKLGLWPAILVMATRSVPSWRRLEWSTYWSTTPARHGSARVPISTKEPTTTCSMATSDGITNLKFHPIRDSASTSFAPSLFDRGQVKVEAVDGHHGIRPGDTDAGPTRTTADICHPCGGLSSQATIHVPYRGAPLPAPDCPEPRPVQ